LDTIHTEHSLPVARDGRVYGRGACDMKSGLAVMGELVRVLREAGVRLSGDVLLTAHGLHEAPWGLGESLRLLIDAGYVGDAVFCMEGHPHELPVVGKGLSIFEVDVLREGGPVHENSAPPGLPHPILAGNRLLQEMTAKNEAFAQQELPLGLGHESYFVGVFQSGDFYNRVPATCHIVGTRRYAPDGTFPAVEAEFQEITERVAGETGVTFDTRIWRQRDGFRIDPEADVTRATRDAYETVTGEMLKLVGMKSVADSSIFVNEAEIPAMQYGPGLESAHADLEWVDVEDMVLVTKVCLLAALNYCGRS
jgi:acetylornithine deacetylase/succinyl-diaminopimelate desuccinylase-like protein